MDWVGIDVICRLGAGWCQLSVERAHSVAGTQSQCRRGRGAVRPVLVQMWMARVVGGGRACHVPAGEASAAEDRADGGGAEQRES